MRKTQVLILSFMLLCSHINISADGLPEYIRIGLFFGSTQKQSIDLSAPGGFTLGGGESTGFARIFDLAETEITITPAENGGFLINGNQFDCPDEMSVKPIGGHIKIGNNTYRGFALIKRAEGGMTVINVVGLEEYLYSVVGKEMSPSWPIEALKAQAVCARTYAVTHLNKYKQYGFDLDDTQLCQVYPGVSSESERTVRAVNETSGQTVHYNGKTVEVFYFSCGGGSTEDSKNVWGGDLPYLKSVPDPYENPNEATRYTWTTSIARTELEEKLSAKGVGVGAIQYIEIISRAPSGRVTELKIVGSEGERTAKLEGVRTLIGYDILYSQQFTISGGLTPVSISGAAVQSGMSVLTADGMANTGNEITVLGANEQKTYSLNRFYGDSFTFEGRGWGHAVGMSQWGAKAMADQGFSYLDIIKHYFTGVEVY